MVHIAFLTLFLGLTSGIQPFELSVSGQAAAVEIVLDDAAVQRLTRPPWKGKLDFGKDLLPHELVARALDADGREVALARQWINLPRPPAEVELALEEGRSGAPGRVRLTWERLTHDPPVATSLTLDGKPLQLDRTGRATLPPYDRGGRSCSSSTRPRATRASTTPRPCGATSPRSGCRSTSGASTATSPR